MCFFLCRLHGFAELYSYTHLPILTVFYSVLVSWSHCLCIGVCVEQLGKQSFDPRFDLWKLTSSGELYPNPTPLVPEDVDSYFEFCGMVLGKLLLEGCLVCSLNRS